MTHDQPPLPFGMDGPALKDEGMARALRGAVPWPDTAMAWIHDLPTGEWFTSDDLVDAVGLPHGEGGANTNNAVGAAVNAAARAGLIQRVDYIRAARTKSHARVISLWRRT